MKKLLVLFYISVICVCPVLGTDTQEIIRIDPEAKLPDLSDEQQMRIMRALKVNDLHILISESHLKEEDKKKSKFFIPLNEEAFILNESKAIEFVGQILNIWNNTIMCVSQELDYKLVLCGGQLGLKEKEAFHFQKDQDPIVPIFGIDPQNKEHIKIMSWYQKYQEVQLSLIQLFNIPEGLHSYSDNPLKYATTLRIGNNLEIIPNQNKEEIIKYGGFSLIRLETLLNGEKQIRRCTCPLANRKSYPYAQALIRKKQDSVYFYADNYCRQFRTQTLEYQFITSTQPKGGLRPNQAYPIMPTDASTPELEAKQNVYRFVESLFAPLLGNTNEDCSLCILLPTTQTQKAILELELLRHALEFKAAELTPEEIAEAIEAAQKQVEEAFVAENPEWVSKARSTAEKLVEMEWERNRQSVIEGTRGNKPKNKNQVKKEKQAAQAQKNKAVEGRYCAALQAQLKRITQEAQSDFSAFLSGVKKTLKLEGISADLLKTGNSGSHNHKLELTQENQSVGSIVIPNKRLGKSLISGICDEIIQTINRGTGRSQTSK